MYSRQFIRKIQQPLISGPSDIFEDYTDYVSNQPIKIERSKTKPTLPGYNPLDLLESYTNGANSETEPVGRHETRQPAPPLPRNTSDIFKGYQYVSRTKLELPQRDTSVTPSLPSKQQERDYHINVHNRNNDRPTNRTMRLELSSDRQASPEKANAEEAHEMWRSILEPQNVLSLHNISPNKVFNEFENIPEAQRKQHVGLLPTMDRRKERRPNAFTDPSIDKYFIRVSRNKNREDERSAMGRNVNLNCNNQKLHAGSNKATPTYQVARASMELQDIFDLKRCTVGLHASVNHPVNPLEYSDRPVVKNKCFPEKKVCPCITHRIAVRGNRKKYLKNSPERLSERYKLYMTEPTEGYGSDDSTEEKDSDGVKTSFEYPGEHEPQGIRNNAAHHGLPEGSNKPSQREERLQPNTYMHPVADEEHDRERERRPQELRNETKDHEMKRGSDAHERGVHPSKYISSETDEEKDQVRQRRQQELMNEEHPRGVKTGSGTQPMEVSQPETGIPMSTDGSPYCHTNCRCKSCTVAQCFLPHRPNTSLRTAIQLCGEARCDASGTTQPDNINAENVFGENRHRHRDNDNEFIANPNHVHEPVERIPHNQNADNDLDSFEQGKKMQRIPSDDHEGRISSPRRLSQFDKVPHTAHNDGIDKDVDTHRRISPKIAIKTEPIGTETADDNKRDEKSIHANDKHETNRFDGLIDMEDDAPRITHPRMPRKSFTDDTENATNYERSPRNYSPEKVGIKSNVESDTNNDPYTPIKKSPKQPLENVLDNTTGNTTDYENNSIAPDGIRARKDDSTKAEGNNESGDTVDEIEFRPRNKESPNKELSEPRVDLHDATGETLPKASDREKDSWKSNHPSNSDALDDGKDSASQKSIHKYPDNEFSSSITVDEPLPSMPGNWHWKKDDGIFQSNASSKASDCKALCSAQHVGGRESEQLIVEPPNKVMEETSKPPKIPTRESKVFVNFPPEVNIKSHRTPSTDLSTNEPAVSHDGTWPAWYQLAARNSSDWFDGLKVYTDILHPDDVAGAVAEDVDALKLIEEGKFVPRKLSTISVNETKNKPSETRSTYQPIATSKSDVSQRRPTTGSGTKNEMDLSHHPSKNDVHKPTMYEDDRNGDTKPVTTDSPPVSKHFQPADYRNEDEYGPVNNTTSKIKNAFDGGILDCGLWNRNGKRLPKKRRTKLFGIRNLLQYLFGSSKKDKNNGPTTARLPSEPDMDPYSYPKRKHVGEAHEKARCPCHQYGSRSKSENHRSCECFHPDDCVSHCHIWNKKLANSFHDTPGSMSGARPLSYDDDPHSKAALNKELNNVKAVDKDLDQSPNSSCQHKKTPNTKCSCRSCVLQNDECECGVFIIDDHSIAKSISDPYIIESRSEKQIGRNPLTKSTWSTNTNTDPNRAQEQTFDEREAKGMYTDMNNSGLHRDSMGNPKYKKVSHSGIPYSPRPETNHRELPKCNCVKPGHPICTCFSKKDSRRSQDEQPHLGGNHGTPEHIAFMTYPKLKINLSESSTVNLKYPRNDPNVIDAKSGTSSIMLYHNADKKPSEFNPMFKQFLSKHTPNDTQLKTHSITDDDDASRHKLNFHSVIKPKMNLNDDRQLYKNVDHDMKPKLIDGEDQPRKGKRKLTSNPYPKIPEVNFVQSKKKNNAGCLTNCFRNQSTSIDNYYTSTRKAKYAEKVQKKVS